MSEKSKTAPYTDRRWTDPPAFEVVGYEEVTEEELSRANAHFEQILIKKGLLKEGEHLTEEEWKKYEI